MSFKSFWKSSGEMKKSDATVGLDAAKPIPAADLKKDVAGPANKPAPKA
ncbi:MAG: hypothetical protein ACMVO3_21290 [Thalassobaculum sp.]